MTESLLGIGVLLVILFLGAPLGFSMMIVGFAGFGLIRGWGPALEMAGQQILDLALGYGFSVLPLFILMGVFVARAQLSDDLYEASNKWLGHFRGGLAMATVAACGGFAAISGSSLATAATMAKVAIPSMRRYKYADSLAAGTVAARGYVGHADTAQRRHDHIRYPHRDRHRQVVRRRNSARHHDSCDLYRDHRGRDANLA